MKKCTARGSKLESDDGVDTSEDDEDEEDMVKVDKICALNDCSEASEERSRLEVFLATG